MTVSKELAELEKQFKQVRKSTLDGWSTVGKHGAVIQKDKVAQAKKVFGQNSAIPETSRKRTLSAETTVMNNNKKADRKKDDARSTRSDSANGGRSKTNKDSSKWADMSESPRDPKKKSRK